MGFVLRILALVMALAGPAAAVSPYAPALTVNDSVITNYDIGQRVALLEALGANGDLRALAIQQLTEDRVKLQAGNDLDIELPEDAIDAGLEEFATSRGLTVENVLSTLEARGIDRQTMDDFVQSGLIWREVIVSRFRERSMPTEADLDTALAMEATTPRELYQMAELALPFAERGEPATVALADRIAREVSRGASFTAMVHEYSRSASAERDGLLDPIPAGQLPAAVRSQILLLRPGQITDPFPISGGLAILRLVAIRQAPPPRIDAEDDTEVRERLRQQLFTERITSFGNGYLQELLGDALIVQK